MESHTVTVTPPSRPPSREDCWSEDATFTLIDAWGRLYLELNRGNLRQKQWEEVADAVNRCHGAVKRRTDVQCKNRIDTLKKKFKIEKAKVTDASSSYSADDDDDGDGDSNGGGGYKSEWMFFEPLDKLLGSKFPVNKPPPPPVTESRPSPAFPFSSFPVGTRSSKRVSLHRRLPSVETPPSFARTPVGLRSLRRPVNNPPVKFSPSAADNDWHSQMRFSALAAAAAAEKGDSDSDEVEEEEELVSKRPKREEKKAEGVNEKDSIRELAMAIEKFGEIYERVETQKQHSLLELEKHRLEVMKDIEFKRLEMFVEAQFLQRSKKSRVERKKSVSTSNW
ncbi:hypothetical protein ACFE04_019347 [Oxalis oulophora]